MAIRKLPSGSFQARLMIDGHQHAETFATLQEAEDWQIVTRARSITGSLPGRMSVREYSLRWSLGYETAPRNTRVFHETNVGHIKPHPRNVPDRQGSPFRIAGLTPMMLTSSAASCSQRHYSAHGNTVSATKNHRRRTLELPGIVRSPLERLIAAAGDAPPHARA